MLSCPEELLGIMRREKKLLAAAAAALAGLLTYGLAVEPQWIEVRRVTVRSPFFARALGGLRIVQLSDLHLERPGRREESVRRLVEGLAPDIIFLTGDYVGWGADARPALAYLSRLRARLGVWGVLGDYDYSRPRTSCLFCHEPGSAARRHGAVRLLKNESVLVRPKGVEVMVTGLDEYGAQEPSLPARLRFDRPAVVLAHDPLLFDRLRGAGPLLCLAGDTHGGQVRLPAALWRLVGYEKCARYPEGLYRRGEAVLYVSRGIGTSHLPLRLGERPELTLLEFVP
jgi:hypothetical protein